jgi:CheY-like chemotaxis protein
LKLIEFGASGPEALKAIREADHQGKPFNIVLLDKRMPDMDGIEVAQKHPRRAASFATADKQVLLDTIERARVLVESQPPVTREIDEAKLNQVA